MTPDVAPPAAPLDRERLQREHPDLFHELRRAFIAEGIDIEISRRRRLRSQARAVARRERRKRRRVAAAIQGEAP
jgi:hypothetical protein